MSNTGFLSVRTFSQDGTIHQKQTVEKIKRDEKNDARNLKGFVIAFRMGMGKTRTMLELFKQKRENCDRQVLVFGRLHARQISQETSKRRLAKQRRLLLACLANEKHNNANKCACQRVGRQT